MARQCSAFESDCEVDDNEHDDTLRFALGTREIRPIELPHMTDDGEPLTLSRASHDVELAAVPHALFVINATGQIEYVNVLGEALAGYTRAELIGQTFGRIVSDLGAAVAETGLLRSGIRFVPAVSGASIHHRSGRDLPVSIALSPHGHDSVIALVTPLTNATTRDDRHDSEIAELVHDFKNPLATMALEMCLLDDKLKDDDHHKLHGVVARVTRNIEYLDRLVQELLDSRAIAAGELSLRRRPAELRSLLQHALERAVPTRDRGYVSLEAGSPVTLTIDELRVERVVSNLLQNALKYAPRSWIVIRLEEIPGHVRVSVIDSGPGIAADDQTYIFDKYRRTSRARSYEGSGLGLYVSKEIVEAHGGRIGVDSVPGIGSRFFFELPMT